jgi:hypothetical protein
MFQKYRFLTLAVFVQNLRHLTAITGAFKMWLNEMNDEQSAESHPPIATDAGRMEMPETLPAIAEMSTMAGTAADLDSQPLNDLGVSVMDQDVLERNVAAQVWHA